MKSQGFLRDDADTAHGISNAAEAQHAATVSHAAAYGAASPAAVDGPTIVRVEPRPLVRSAQAYASEARARRTREERQTVRDVCFVVCRARRLCVARIAANPGLVTRQIYREWLGTEVSKARFVGKRWPLNSKGSAAHTSEPRLARDLQGGLCGYAARCMLAGDRLVACSTSPLIRRIVSLTRAMSTSTPSIMLRLNSNP
jgi:hypothetical protein